MEEFIELKVSLNDDLTIDKKSLFQIALWQGEGVYEPYQIFEYMDIMKPKIEALKLQLPLLKYEATAFIMGFMDFYRSQYRVDIDYLYGELMNFTGYFETVSIYPFNKDISYETLKKQFLYVNITNYIKMNYGIYDTNIVNSYFCEFILNSREYFDEWYHFYNDGRDNVKLSLNQKFLDSAYQYLNNLSINGYFTQFELNTIVLNDKEYSINELSFVSKDSFEYLKIGDVEFQIGDILLNSINHSNNNIVFFSDNIFMNSEWTINMTKNDTIQKFKDIFKFLDFKYSKYGFNLNSSKLFEYIDNYNYQYGLKNGLFDITLNYIKDEVFNDNLADYDTKKAEKSLKVKNEIMAEIIYFLSIGDF